MYIVNDSINYENKRVLSSVTYKINSIVLLLPQILLLYRTVGVFISTVDRMKLYSEVSSDPFELRIRQAQDTSTKPSFNTPQSTPSQGSANYNKR